VVVLEPLGGGGWGRIREVSPELLDVYATSPESAGDGDSLAAAGSGVLAWAEEADAIHPGGLTLGVTHEAPLVAATLLGSGRALSDFHGLSLPHLSAVRLRPPPAEPVDLVEWAARC
jgi:hypothetical protein